MTNQIKLLSALFLLLAGAAHADKVREVSVSKIIARGGQYQLRPGEKQIGLRVLSSQTVTLRKSKDALDRAESKKEGRILFVGGAGKYKTDLGAGKVKFEIVEGEACASDASGAKEAKAAKAAKPSKKADKGEKREKREKSEKREKPRRDARQGMDPAIARYVDEEGRIDFSKLHRGF